jgi:hypothetical protein
VVPFVEREPSLFISSSKLIHSRYYTLRFCAFIRVLEFHDYMIPEDSDNNHFNSNDNSSTDSLPGSEPSSGSSLCPWPRIYRVAGDRVSPSGEPWPSLPGHGGGVASALASASEPGQSYKSSPAPVNPAKSYPSEGERHEESARPSGHDQSQKGASNRCAPNESVRQPPNGYLTVHLSSVAAPLVKTCRALAMEMIDIVESEWVEGPTPDMLLLSGRAPPDVPWWDPMADESFFCQHAPSGHVLHYDLHVELTAMRDLFADWEWDPISVELEVAAMQPTMVSSQPCSHPSGGFSPPGYTMHSELSQLPSVHNPTLEVMRVAIGTPPSVERPNPAHRAQTSRSQSALLPQVPDSQFINTSRGASPSSMVAGAIPGSPTLLVHMISSPVPPTSLLLSPLPR